MTLNIFRFIQFSIPFSVPRFSNTLVMVVEYPVDVLHAVFLKLLYYACMYIVTENLNYTWIPR